MKKLFFFSVFLLFGFFSSAQSGVSEILMAAPDAGETAFDYRYVTDFSTDGSALYVAYKQKGVAVYESGVWTKYKCSNSDLPSDTVFQVSVYDGKMYVSTLKGLAIYDGTNWNVINQASGLSSDTVLSYYKNGIMEYFVAGNSLNVYNGSNYQSYPLDGYYAGFGTMKNVSRIGKTMSGQIWISRLSGGLYLFNGSIANQKSTMKVYSFLPENDRVWLGGKNTGMMCFGSDSVQSIYKRFNDGYEHKQGMVRSIFKGNNGHVYYTQESKLYEVFDDRINTIDLVEGKSLLAFQKGNRVYLLEENATVQTIKLVDLSVYNSFNLKPNGSGYTNDTDYSNFKKLDLNNVSAPVHSSGGMFWDMNGTAMYELPKGSGKSCAFTNSIWIGGYDAQQNLHIAAKRFNEQDYWPGPIVSNTDTTTKETADQYDRVWKVNKQMIEEFKFQYNNGTVASGTYLVPFDIVSWPGDHPSTGNQMAPYFDNNGDGIYNYLDGDYPEILGDAMLWWVMNDFIPNHDATNAPPLKVEIYSSFYCFRYDNAPNDSLEQVNNLTFLNVQLINRSANQYDSCYLSVFTDFDIGYAFDDFLGCNVELNAMYGYNGYSIDGNGEAGSYGGPIPAPPVFSMSFLNGPIADLNDGIDNDKDFQIDEVDERCLLNSVTTFSNGASGLNDPQTAMEHYYYMTSRWNDGTHVKYGGIGHQSDPNASNINCDYLYPGSSNINGWGQNGQVLADWSEIIVNNNPADRRGVGSSGPFTFEVGETISLDLGYIFTQVQDTSSIENSIQTNFDLTEDAQQWFGEDLFPSNYIFEIDSFLTSPKLEKLDFKVYPNPSNSLVNIRLDVNDQFKTNYMLVDIRGRSLAMGTLDNNGHATIDLSRLSTGIYFIHLVHNKQSYYRKIIKN